MGTTRGILAGNLRTVRFAALALAWSAIFTTAALRAQRDNVLVVIADDLGVDNVVAYGEGPNPPPTPNIDALAARGVLFRNAWANPMCSPTRACLHTGRYSTRTGVGKAVQYQPPQVYNPQGVLPLHETTLPELLDLRQSGHAHALIGKWHLGDETNGASNGPNRAGWSHFAGMLGRGGNYYRWPRTVNGVTRTSEAYSTTKMVDDALAWIRSVPEPWVVYLTFNAPHRPWHKPPPSLHTRQLQGVTQPTPLYKAAVEAMDTEIGRLLASLGPALARTNVIFMGDNGTPHHVSEPPFLPTHAKGTMYEGGVNVPLVVAGPAVRAPGREENALVSAVDVFTTVADLCGVSPVTAGLAVDGVSFVPHLATAGLPSTRSSVFAEWFNGPTPIGSGGGVAVRNAAFKLIRHGWPVPSDELYDLSVDPFEATNLLAGSLTAAQRAEYTALRAEIASVRTNVGSFRLYGAETCRGSNGLLSIQCWGMPSVGGSYTVHLREGAMLQPAILLIGASRTSAFGVPLPFSLAAIGSAPSCFLWSSPDIALVTQTGDTGAAWLTVNVPSGVPLPAGSVYHSWLVLDPAISPLSITSTDGTEVFVGG